MKKGLRMMVVSVIVVGLLLGSVGSALAQESPKTLNVFGKVIAKDQANSSEGFIELKTKQGNIEVKVTADTQYKNGSFSDIVVGKKVALVAEEVNGILVARKVLIVPSEPTYKHLVGVVTSVSGTTVNVADEQGDTFAFNAKPITAVRAIKVEPGQRVIAVVPKDLRAMKVMAVRISSAKTNAKAKAGEETESKEAKAGSRAESRIEATERVICVNASPELVKNVCMEMPPQLRREVFIDLPPDKIKEIWMNLLPELAKEIWMNLPPELVKEIWLNLPPEIKKIWIDLPPQLAIREVFIDLPPEQLKQIWVNMPPKLAKEIWVNLPPQLAKKVW